eukprot:sb/3467991/
MSSIKYLSETITIAAEITILDSFIGPLKIAPSAKPNWVTFHTMLKDYISDSREHKKTSHQINGITWLITGGKFGSDQITFMVSKFDSNGKEVIIFDPENNFGYVGINITGPFLNSLLTTYGRCNSGITMPIKFLKTADLVSAVVTFTINDEPLPSEADVPKGVDFGREYISLYGHGNCSFKLQDDSRIPLSSYILARNSPVLKRFIEEEGEQDHDVSDFEPGSVKIFIDACYTGTLELLTDDTEFKVFRDFVKMVAVFQVGWIKPGCRQFYQNHLP